MDTEGRSRRKARLTGLGEGVGIQGCSGLLGWNLFCFVLFHFILFLNFSFCTAHFKPAWACPAGRSAPSDSSGLHVPSSAAHFTTRPHPRRGF